MKHLAYILTCTLSLALVACNGDRQLRQRATELCRYIPDHTLLPDSRRYMTDEFYAVLDTMFNLPEQEDVAHEWLYYFVTGNGGTIADFTVDRVTITAPDRAVADITVRQQWEDGSFDPDSDIEQHRMDMKRVNGVWLIDDFDNHKADCIRYIAIFRQEQALRYAMADWLVTNIGSAYRHGQWCVPTLMIVAVEEQDSLHARVYGDFWVEWYNLEADTLVTVSGGNHSGYMTVDGSSGHPQVTAFVQTDDGAGNDPSARRIFGSHYDVYSNMHANPAVRQSAREYQLRQFIRSHDIPAHFYQDYAWPAVALF